MANADRGQSSAQASAVQSQAGKGLHISGSSAVHSAVKADGGASASADAGGNNGTTSDNGTSTDNSTTTAAPDNDNGTSSDNGTTTDVPGNDNGTLSDNSTTTAEPGVNSTTEAPVVDTTTGAASTTAAASGNGSVLIGGGPVQTGVSYPPIVDGPSPPAQVPGVWAALDALRGKPALTAEEIQAILAAAHAGEDYPILAEIPNQTGFNCANVKQAGFYADTDSRFVASTSFISLILFLFTKVRRIEPHNINLNKTKQNYTTLHHITPHYTTLHHITPHYTTLHHIAPHYTTLHYITPHYTTLHHITPHYSTLHDITLHFNYSTLYYIILHYIF